MTTDPIRTKLDEIDKDFGGLFRDPAVTIRRQNRALRAVLDLVEDDVLCRAAGGREAHDNIHCPATLVREAIYAALLT